MIVGNNVNTLTTIGSVYLLSGVIQPLLMSIMKVAGIADEKCQIYMLFYYFGPSLVVLPSIFPSFSKKSDSSSVSHEQKEKNESIDEGQGEGEHFWKHVSMKTYITAATIATSDLFAQTLNYTGASLSGPTLFAIIYSSVTIWAAIFSILILYRELNSVQCYGIIFVFFGLVITAADSINFGPDVFRGTVYVFLGSMLHGLVYALNEYLMKPKRLVKKGSSTEVYTCNYSEYLSANMNCSFQMGVAFFGSLIWQLTYTSKHFTESILIPMEKAGTTLTQGMALLFLFALTSFFHALCYFHCLQKLPGGSASAGVLKGFQAVLVFIATSLFFCGRIGGEEMCFTSTKFVSFLVVSTGVFLYYKGTKSNKSGIDGVNVFSSKVEDGESKVPLIDDLNVTHAIYGTVFNGDRDV